MNDKPVSVIVIESQPLMRKAISTALTTEGFDVIAELSESAQATKIASKHNPGLILLAINTSSPCELNAITVLRKTLPTASIIALITGEFPGQDQTVLDHGADLVLSKSSSRSELLSAIKQLKDLQVDNDLSIS
jgi:DNA-binding NarL/FixJ family response regulator